MTDTEDAKQQTATERKAEIKQAEVKQVNIDAERRKKWMMIYVGSPKADLVVSTVLTDLGYNFCTWEPTYEIIQKVRGAQTIVRRKVFPGYILVNFDYTGNEVDDTLLDSKSGYLLRRPGAGCQQTLDPSKVDSNKPVMLTEEEVDRFTKLEQTHLDLGEEITPTVEVGNFVEITSGPFIGIKGTVTSIQPHAITVELAVFGRMISVGIPPSSIVKTTFVSKI